MGCVEKGQLRAYLDGELSGEDTAKVQRHLAECAGCVAELETLSSNAALAASTFASLAPAAMEVPRPTWNQLRSRADARNRRPVTIVQGVSTMFKNLFGFAGSSRMRLAASTSMVAVAVALLFTLSPVQTLASSFLSIFRVQKLAVVTVDPSTISKLGDPGQLGSFTTTGDKSAKQISLADARKLSSVRVGTPTNLPSGLRPEPKVTATGAESVTFVPDLKKVRAYLSSIGATDVKLPDNLDGAPITVQVPQSVRLLYTEKGAGDTAADGSPKPVAGSRFMYLGITTSPTMTVPDGINVEQIRSEMLKIPGLPADLVSQIKSIDDWRSTLIVPAVKGSSHEVTVQGVKGVVFTDANGQGTSVMWLKDGQVYALSGSISESEIMSAANSIQ